MPKEDIDKLAKNEFKNLKKSRYKQVNNLLNKNPDIFLISKKTPITERIIETINNLNYHYVGICDDGRKAVKRVEKIKPDLIFIGTDLDDDYNGINVGMDLSKYNIPLIYIFDNKTDFDVDPFIMENYGFIYDNYNQNQIKFAIEIAIRTSMRSIHSVEVYENKFHEKNTELVIEKLYSTLLLTLSVILILAGVISRNVTFIQWIIFIPGVINLFLAIVSLKKQEKPVPYTEPPFVSIFIPAHNEEYTIEATVRSICSMNYYYNDKVNFEVIVVNDGSTDNTGTILSKLKNEFNNLRIITRSPPKSGKGKGFVLNDALILAKGEIIGVFDADTRVDENYLSTIIPYLNNEKVVAVQSRVRMYNKDENFLANMQDIEFAGFGNILRAKDILGYEAFLGGNGQFTKKEAVEKAGKWDGFAVTEDLNLSIKVELAGGGVRYCPDVAIYQEAVTNWSDFYRQRTRWAIGNFETLFIFFSRIVFSKLSLIKKIGIISHIANYAFNLFIFTGFIIFAINILAWFVWGIPTIIRMEAPLIIGVLSAVAFFPGIVIALIRDDKKYLTFLKDLVGYWIYCFYLIPLFFKTMYVMITRRERKWDKTEHKGNKEQ